MKIIIIILSFLIISTIYSQPVQQWVKKISSANNHNDAGYDIVSDGAGSVYIAGSYYNLPNLSNSFYVAKLSSSAGTVTWERLNNGTTNATCAARKILIDGAGNIYAAGIIQNTTQDIFVAKYTPGGNSIWTRTYTNTSTSDEDVNSICLSSDNSLYIAGYKSVSGDKSYLTLKYDSSGTVQWAQTFNPGSNPDEANDIAIGDSGYVYVSGTGSDCIQTIKYSSAGTFKWVKNYSNTGAANGYGVAVDVSGNVYVTGCDFLFPTKGIVTVKYNSQGSMLWDKHYQYSPVAGPDYASDIRIDASSNIYIAGNSNDNTGHTDISLIKYDAQGNQLWVKQYNSPADNDDIVKKMTLDASGNIYQTGYSIGIGTSNDIVLIKYNPAGVLQWAQRYNGSDNLNDGAEAIAIESTGNIFLNGYSYSTSLGKDMCIIKYSQVTGIEPVNHEVPAEFKLSQNYPNPFNPSTNIEFNIPKQGFVKLAVYDITGKESARLINQNLNAGSYKISFDGAGLSSGTYFYKLETDRFTDVKKMILVK